MKNISYKRYIETFHVLEKYSEEYDYQLEHLVEKSKSLRKGFSILDIGAGTGGFARSFLKKCPVKPSSYTAIEPSEEHIESIKKNLAGFTAEKNIIRGKFTPEMDFGRKFDLIILSHSVYWFAPHIEEHLVNAVKHLKCGGKAVIYAGAPSNFCCVMNKLVRGVSPKNAFTSPHTVSSREVMQALQKHGIRFDIVYLPGKLNATEIFKPKNKNLKMNLISFALFSEAKDLSKEDLKYAQDLIELLSYETEGKTKLNLAFAAITIKK